MVAFFASRAPGVILRILLFTMKIAAYMKDDNVSPAVFLNELRCYPGPYLAHIFFTECLFSAENYICTTSFSTN